jgi:hypothetical protein
MRRLPAAARIKIARTDSKDSRLIFERGGMIIPAITE